MASIEDNGMPDATSQEAGASGVAVPHPRVANQQRRSMWARSGLHGLSLFQRFLVLGAILFVSGFVVIGLVIGESTRSLTNRIVQDRLSASRVAAAGASQIVLQARSELVGYRGMLALVTEKIAPPYNSFGEVHRVSPSAFDGGIALADTLGRIVAISSGSILGEESQVPGFVAEPGFGDLSLSPVFRASNGEPVVAVGLGLEAPNDNLRLVGVMTTRSGPLRDLLLSSIDAMKTGHAEIIDQNGFVILTTEDGGELSRGDHPEFYSRMAISQSDGVETVEHVPASHESEVDDGDHVMAIAGIPGTRWSLAAGGSETETLAPVAELRRNLYFWSAAVGAVVAIIGGFAVNRLVRPVRALSETARSVAAGDLDIEISVSEGGEIADLASDIELMRKSLVVSVQRMQGFNAELAHTVEEQTRALRTRNEELIRANDIVEALSATLEVPSITDLLLGYSNRLEGLVSAQMFASLGGVSEFTLLKSTAEHRESGLDVRIDFGDIHCEEMCQLSPADFAEITNIQPSPETVSVTLIPLWSSDRLEGLLALQTLVAADHFDDAAQPLWAMKIVCRHAAVALQNARLFGELQHKEQLTRTLLRNVLSAQEGERQRLARELHDETAQSLSATLIALGSLRERLPQDAIIEIARVEEMTKEAVAELRKTIYALRPTALDDHGLFAGVRAYARQRLANGGMQLEIENTGVDGELDPEIELVVFRVVQEAINNIARHANATSVRIRFTANQDSISVEVSDDGVGFDQAALTGASSSGHGLGLLGMHERVEFVGGTISIESEPGRGTDIRISVPHKIGAFER